MYVFSFLTRICTVPNCKWNSHPAGLTAAQQDIKLARTPSNAGLSHLSPQVGTPAVLRLESGKPWIRSQRLKQPKPQLPGAQKAQVCPLEALWLMQSLLEVLPGRQWIGRSLMDLQVQSWSERLTMQMATMDRHQNVEYACILPLK